jgi:iron complex outermembrane receptor protein
VSLQRRLLGSALAALPIIFFQTVSAQAQIAQAQAASDQGDEIVVTGRVSTFGATKSDIPILETARSVSVIDADEFLERGSLTLDDTLNYTAGVVGDTFGFSTRGDFPRVRGLDVPEYLDNIQVLFGFYNNARSDIYTLEQVEVLKGPASVLYGQGSPGGILNTVSKKAGSENLDREIVLDYGTHNRFQAAGDFGIDLSGDGEWTARLVGLIRDSDTQVDFVEDNALVFAPSVTFENANTTITALVNYTDRESDTSHQFLPLSVSGCGSDEVQISEAEICAGTTGNEVDPSLYVGSPDFNRYDTESFSLTLFGQQKLNDIFSLEGTARYRNNEADYRQSWVSFLGAGTARTTPDGTAIGRSWYDAPAGSNQFALDSRLRASFETGPASHEILAGVNYQDVETERRAAFLGRPTNFNLFNPVYDGSEIPSEAAFNAARGLSESTTETIGYYVNDQISVGNFVLNAGVRFDDLESGNGTTVQDDSATSFSFGGLYKTSFGLNPYINYAESFQATVGVDANTGENLKPQEGEQIEIGLKYQPPGTRTYITAAYFDIKQSNLPNPQALQNAASQQEGVAKIKGFEVEAQTALGDIYLDGAFSTLDTEDPNGIPISSIPEVQGSAWVTWKPSQGQLEGFRLGAGVRHAGNNESQGVSFLASNNFQPSVVKVETDGYTVLDGLIGYSFEQVDLTLNARNLFDTEYYGTCLARGDCFPGEGRTVVARAAYRF